MKRILGLLLFALFAPCFAADNIKMVTYFPVPYLAYNELGVVGTCDVGLLGSCGLEAGKYLSVRPDTSLAQSGLNYGVLALKGGELDLQSTALTPHARSYVLRVGNYPANKAQEALLTFRHRLEVGSLQGGDLQSIEADNVAYTDSLTLFGSAFPTCSKDNHKISWQRLTFDNKESTFLVCGEGECTDKYGAWTTYSEGSSSSVLQDTCNGNISSEFTCSGTAMTCRDVVATTTKSGYAATYGAATDTTSSTADTCDGDTTNTYTPACSSASSCVDVYRDYTGLTDCKCGGTDSLGNQYEMSCISCNQMPGDDFNVSTYCAANPGVSCCNGNTPVSCPHIKKRTVACGNKYTTTYKYRTVTCCGKSS